MNIKKIKLDLTVNLLNQTSNSNILQNVQEAMATWSADVGNFVDTTILNNSGINSDLVKHTYAMQYENCTLNVDVVHNQKTSSQYLNGFSLV